MHSVKVNDTTKKRKTAENLLEDLEEVYKELCEIWATIVVGLVTDAAGDARKARRLFALKHPRSRLLCLIAMHIRYFSTSYMTSSIIFNYF